MPAPPRSFLTVTDTAIRWQVPALDIAGWAIDGEIALSAVLPTVETADKQIASGIVEIDGADVVALFRRESTQRLLSHGRTPGHRRRLHCDLRTPRRPCRFIS